MRTSRLTRMWNCTPTTTQTIPLSRMRMRCRTLHPLPHQVPITSNWLSTGRSSWSTRRTGSGTYDRTSDPASYGLSMGSNADWHPDRAEFAQQIRSFLADIDPTTGYLRG
jgi:hypothetical protein